MYRTRMAVKMEKVISVNCLAASISSITSKFNLSLIVLNTLV